MKAPTFVFQNVQMTVRKAKTLFFLLLVFSAALIWLSTYGVKYLPTPSSECVNNCLKANPPVIYWNVAGAVLRFFM